MHTVRHSLLNLSTPSRTIVVIPHEMSARGAGHLKGHLHTKVTNERSCWCPQETTKNHRVSIHLVLQKTLLFSIIRDIKNKSQTKLSVVRPVITAQHTRYTKQEQRHHKMSKAKETMNEMVLEFWDDRPCNIRHSEKEIGSKEYFEEVTRRKYFVESHILSFANFSAYENKEVLEVGCGIGTAAQSFMEARANYTGIDVSPKSIELANKRKDLFGLTGNIYVADIQSSTIQGRQFDLVYSFGVLHHIEDLPSALKNIYAMLKPGGEFKLMMYATNSWKNACIQSGLDQFEAQSGVPIANTYTNEEITTLLSDFINIDIHQDHIFLWNIEHYKNYEYKKEPWFEAMPERLLRTLETTFGWHLLITCHKPLA